MNTWLPVVASFLGCQVSDLDPTKVYIVTAAVIGVIIWSFCYLLSRLGRK